jgi:hypothetical protein
VICSNSQALMQISAVTMVMRFATPRRNVITDTSLISFSLSSSTPAS